MKSVACGDILTISISTRCPAADTPCCNLLDKISISVKALSYFSCKNIFLDFHKINFKLRSHLINCPYFAIGKWVIFWNLFISLHHSRLHYLNVIFNFRIFVSCFVELYQYFRNKNIDLSCRCFESKELKKKKEKKAKEKSRDIKIIFQRVFR